MTELWVITFLTLAGFGFSTFLFQTTRTFPKGSPETQLFWQTIQQGCRLLVVRMVQTWAVVCVPLSLALFLVRWKLLPETIPSWSRALMVSGAFLSGSFGLLLASIWMLRSVLTFHWREHDAVKTPINIAVKRLVRRGGAVSILLLGSLLLTLVLIVGVYLWVQTIERVDALLPSLVAAFAWGAGISAWLFQAFGSTWPRFLSQKRFHEERSLLQALGRLGQIAETSLGLGSGFLLSLLVTLAASVMVGFRVSVSNSGAHGNPLPVVLFPMCGFSFCILATIFGLMVVQTEEKEGAHQGITRGLFVTLVLTATGYAGASIWLLGPFWGWFFGCCLVGLLASPGLMSLMFWQRNRADSRIQHTIRWDNAWLIGGVWLVALFMGQRTGLVYGGAYGVVLACLGMVTPISFVLALQIAGALRLDEHRESPGELQLASILGESYRTMRHYRSGVGLVSGLSLLVAGLVQPRAIGWISNERTVVISLVMVVVGGSWITWSMGRDEQSGWLDRFRKRKSVTQVPEPLDQDAASEEGKAPALVKDRSGVQARMEHQVDELVRDSRWANYMRPLSWLMWLVMIVVVWIFRTWSVGIAIGWQSSLLLATSMVVSFLMTTRINDGWDAIKKQDGKSLHQENDPSLRASFDNASKSIHESGVSGVGSMSLMAFRGTMGQSAQVLTEVTTLWMINLIPLLVA
jgi:hypothetical protein